MWVKAQLEHFMREQGEELIILCIIFAVKGSREIGLQLNGGLGIKEVFF